MNKKIIAITGSGSGLGKEAAIELAKRGHKVYATTQYISQAEELNVIAEKEKINLVSFKLDILLEDDRKLLDNIDIDVLINNAAINESGSIAEIDVNKIKEVFETNVFSTISLTQRVLKNMIYKNKGRIVIVSSIYGIISDAFFGPYSSSKFALESLSHCLRKELEEIDNNKVSVAVIEPGAYATGFNQEMILKQYRWMKIYSYFRNKLLKLRRKQLDKFNLIEQNKFSSIIKKYVKAVEDEKCKAKYKAPISQHMYAKLRQIFS
jgi:short-subunit dehydrogenase